MKNYPCICTRDFDSKKIPNSNNKWNCRMKWHQTVKKNDILFYNKRAYKLRLNGGSFSLNLKIKDGTLISKCKEMAEAYPLHLLYNEKGRHVQTFFDPYLFKHYFRHLSKKEYEKELTKQRFDL